MQTQSPHDSQFERQLKAQGQEIKNLRTELGRMKLIFQGGILSADSTAPQIPDWRALNQSLDWLVSELHQNTLTLDRVAELLRQDSSGTN